MINIYEVKNGITHKEGKYLLEEGVDKEEILIEDLGVVLIIGEDDNSLSLIGVIKEIIGRREERNLSILIPEKRGDITMRRK